MKVSGWLGLVMGALVLSGTAVAQTTHQVDLLIQPVEGRVIPEFYFEPVGLFIEPGDTVRFMAVTPHESYGMAMRIVVGEASGPGVEPSADFSPEGTFATAGTVLNAPALDAQSIIDAGTYWNATGTPHP